MRLGERVERLRRFGFTEPQASFLVSVMLHAGVCVQRQYRAATGRSHGHGTRSFFHDLVLRRYATPHRCASRRAVLYHVHAKPLYDAIGESDNRHRRPMVLTRAIERLMVLDAVLAQPENTWLGTEADKVAHFTVSLPIGREHFPQLTFESDTSMTVRYFPDKLPIGVHPNGRTYEFVYGVHRATPGDFRVFLYRHAALLRQVPRWTVRLLVPPHLQPFAAAYEQAAHEELGIRLAPKTVEELRWFFGARREAGSSGAPPSDPERFRRARRAFGAPRYRVLYRHWLTAGDPVLARLGSPVLPDAIAHGFGTVETQMLPRPYHQLSPLIGTS